jgi:hypothetical protein
LSAAEELPATAISSFGEVELLRTHAEAERMLGWRVLRTDDPRYTIVERWTGAVQWFKNPLPYYDLRYTAPGHYCDIQAFQDPESYPASRRESESICADR